MKQQKRIRANKKGIYAEWFACIFLFCKGYKIIKRRFKVSAGEIDIIAKKGSLIIFVEVKARKSGAQALDAISFNSQRRISNAAQWWLSKQRGGGEFSWRFDVVAIVDWRLPIHFKDVW